MARKLAIPSALEPLILEIRGHRVILDADLARLYGVHTKRFNEAFKRNRGRFPGDFAFRISDDEYVTLRNRPPDSKASAPNWSQFATSSASRRGRAYRPWAFTEHGALMAANVLRSERAIGMSVYVIRAFVRLRDGLAANSAILKRLAEIDRTLLQHDSALRDIYQKLLPLLEPPINPPRRGIGFHRIG
ncbi:MAG: ORF6N domain-containing protein [Burkholderiales bacterium]